MAERSQKKNSLKKSVSDSDTSQQKNRRINAYVPNEVYEQLALIAKRRGVTMTEVLRHALGLEKWFFDTHEEGGKICVERNDKLYEVVFPW